jgi:P63C domain-containing protein
MIKFLSMENPTETKLPDPSKGGEARARKLSPERRSEIARQAVKMRWAKARGLKEVTPEIINPEPRMPEAKLRGVLRLALDEDFEIPCYVLDDGQRLIGRTSATEWLTGIKGGGGFEKYLGVGPLKSFINMDLVLERLVAFRLPEVEGLERNVKGLPTDLMIEICRGMVAALEASVNPKIAVKLTERQAEIAVRASMFLAACAKVGLDALVDEATGNQYERAEDALQVKLRAYLAEEMRKWEKTFPDELWKEFGRLTGWKGSVTKRPKYWGKLVTELVYEYLDPDVAKWLKDHVPQPQKGQNWHQYLSGQYGLRKLIEHIWMLIGISSTCRNIGELYEKMAEKYGRIPIQYRLYLPPPKRSAQSQ